MWEGHLKTAINSLRRSKWRTVLTMLGVIIGISSVVTIVSLGEGLKDQVVGQVGQLGSDIITIRSGKLTNQSSDGQVQSLNLYAFLVPSTLTTKDVVSIGKLPAVSNALPIEFVASSANAEGTQLSNISVIGTTPDMPNLTHEKLAYGTFFSSDAGGQHLVVIGNDIAHKLFNELNPIGHSLSILGQNFIVGGVLAPSAGSFLSVAQTDFNSAIFLPTQTADTLTSGHTNILQILVKAKDTAGIDSAVGQIKQTLSVNHQGQDDFTVLKQYELLGVASRVVNTTTGFISSIAAISLLVGGIGIMDIMLVSVSERTREIGIRKALGATNRQIMSQFLIEGMALTIGGGFIGVIASLLINLILKIYTTWQPVISPWILGLAVGVSVAVGIVFSLAPAAKAARKDPIEALRNE